VNREAARIVGMVAALVMVGLIVTITVTGRWPMDAPRTHAGVKGVLSLAPEHVARIEIAAGDARATFEHSAEGQWRSDGMQADPILARHLDAALRLMNISEPRRVLTAAELDMARLSEFGLSPARFQVIVAADDGARTGFAFGGMTVSESTQYVQMPGQAKVYLLARDVGEEWELALDLAKRANSDATADVAADASSAKLLLPVSIAQIWAVEVVSGGVMYRFERDPAGDWFYHVGQHTHGAGGLVHRADPKLAPAIAAELGALERLPVGDVIAPHPVADELDSYGLEHPPLLMLLYGRDSAGPVARVAFGNAVEGSDDRYARVQETDAVVTIPVQQAEHLTKLLQLAGAPS